MGKISKLNALPLPAIDTKIWGSCPARGKFLCFPSPNLTQKGENVWTFSNETQEGSSGNYEDNFAPAAKIRRFLSYGGHLERHSFAWFFFCFEGKRMSGAKWLVCVRLRDRWKALRRIRNRETQARNVVHFQHERAIKWAKQSARLPFSLNNIGWLPSGDSSSSI